MLRGRRRAGRAARHAGPRRCRPPAPAAPHRRRRAPQPTADHGRRPVGGARGRGGTATRPRRAGPRLRRRRSR
ncbi:hypothetical protein E1285_05350 [Actinomadura sp. 7K507]|nr:hypothetical protein E1285_05350 [Actinomadura sp. 7K507]